MKINLKGTIKSHALLNLPNPGFLGTTMHLGNVMATVIKVKFIGYF